MTLSLPHITFSGVFERRTATGSKAFSFFISHYLCIDECHYSYRDDLPENLDKTTAQECKAFTSSVHCAPFLNGKRHLIFKRSDKMKSL